MRAYFEADDPELDLSADARHWMLRSITDWSVGPEAAYTAELVVSELVTNAVRHARTALTVTLTLEGAVLRIEVFDRDTRLPVAVAADEEATGGRGLVIVAAIADNWGAQTAEVDGISGKIVWAEISV